jgi:hypothetical protein
MPPTETTTPRVFVDTNVFYPVRVAGLVLSCVDDGLLELCVSEHLLDAIERVLVEHKGLAAVKAKVFRDAVAANAIRAVHPADYEALAATLVVPDPDDLWHSPPRSPQRRPSSSPRTRPISLALAFPMISQCPSSQPQTSYSSA